MRWSNKTWACPFFAGDEKLCVHCERGQRVVFPDADSRRDYIGRYCASVEGWPRCSIAALLTDYYDRKG